MRYVQSLGQSMVTSRSVPQQMEQMLSARAGHIRFTGRLLQMGHAKPHLCSAFVVFEFLPGIIMPHFQAGSSTAARPKRRGAILLRVY
jgi:hypothetical protein